jgi:hypothetical protein
LGWCQRCKFYGTETHIGCECIDCGTIHADHRDDVFPGRKERKS